MQISENKTKNKYVIAAIITLLIVAICYFAFSTFDFYKSKKNNYEIVKYLERNEQDYFKNVYLVFKNKYLAASLEESTLAEIEKKIKAFEIKEKKTEEIIKKNVFLGPRILKIKENITHIRNAIKIFFDFLSRRENNNFFEKKYIDYIDYFEKHFNFAKLEIINQKLDFFYLNTDRYQKIKEKLDQEFYGQEKLKAKIIEEFLIKQDQNNVNCFFLIGCDGSGKTTFIKTFAKTIEYEFIEIIIDNYSKYWNITEIIEEKVKNAKIKKIVILLDFNGAQDYSHTVNKIKKKYKKKDVNILFFQTDNQNEEKYKNNSLAFEMDFYKSHDLNNIFQKIIAEKIKNIKEKFKNLDFNIKFEKLFLINLLKFCQSKNTNESFDSKKCACVINIKKINKIVNLLETKINDILSSKKKNNHNDITFEKIEKDFPDINQQLINECLRNGKKCRNKK